MIQLTIIEIKFLQLYKNTLTIQEFEEWIYGNEDRIAEVSSDQVYQELMLVNYKSKDARHEVSKIIRIDYERLEIYEIQTLLSELLDDADIEINELRFETGNYEPFWTSLCFKIGETNFRMNNQLDKIQFDHGATDAEKTEIFGLELGKAKDLITAILESIGTKYFRIWNRKSHDQSDPLTLEHDKRRKEDETMIIIDGHQCYLNEDYISSKMRWSRL